MSNTLDTLLTLPMWDSAMMTAISSAQEGMTPGRCRLATPIFSAYIPYACSCSHTVCTDEFVRSERARASFGIDGTSYRLYRIRWQSPAVTSTMLSQVFELVLFCVAVFSCGKPKPDHWSLLKISSCIPSIACLLPDSISISICYFDIVF